MSSLLAKRPASALHGNDDALASRKRAKGNATASDTPAFSGRALSALMRRDGQTKAVMVNQRALIDKMLARYAQSNAVIRELAQNADDAGASLLRIGLTLAECSEDRRGKGTRGRARGKRVASEDGARHCNTAGGVECSEISVSNDGRTFVGTDWERVAKIAEGNPDENTVGMFGVGFYSVFSMCETPCIRSGGRCLAFHWEGDQLAYATADDPFAMMSGYTTEFVLPLRTPTALNVRELAGYLESALYFSKTLRQVEIAVGGEVVAVVERKSTSARPRTLAEPLGDSFEQHESLQLHAFGPCTAREVETLVRFTSEGWSGGGELSTRSRFTAVTCPCAVSASKEYGAQCEAILKKRLPTKTSVNVLLPCGDTSSATAGGGSGGSGGSGRVFVGMSTHQSTGCAFHFSAHLYPTIERENVDFAAHSPLALWNKHLTRIAGRCARALFDHMAASHSSESEKGFDALLRSFSFDESAPSALVGQLLSSSFFGGPPPLVFTSLGRIAADCCLLPHQGIEELLESSALALVSNAHAESGFFRALQQHVDLPILSLDVLCSELDGVVLSADRLLKCIRWILEHHKGLKRQAAKLKRAISYEDALSGSVVTLHSVALVADHAVFGDAPLPSTCLPSWVTRHVPVPALASALGARRLTVAAWVKCAHSAAFFDECFARTETAAAALEFISRHFFEIRRVAKADFKKLCARLCEHACVPAKKGPIARLCVPTDVCLERAAGNENIWTIVTKLDEASVVEDDNERENSEMDEEEEEEQKEEEEEGEESGSEDEDGVDAKPEQRRAKGAGNDVPLAPPPRPVHDRVLARAFLLLIGARARPPIGECHLQERAGQGMRSVVSYFARSGALSDEDVAKLRQMVPLELARGGCGPVGESSMEEQGGAVFFVSCAPARELRLPCVMWEGLRKSSREYRLLRRMGVREVLSLGDIAAALPHQPHACARSLVEHVLQHYDEHFGAELSKRGSAHAVFPRSDGSYCTAREAVSSPNPFVPHVAPWFVEQAQKCGVWEKLGCTDHPTSSHIVEEIVREAEEAQRHGADEWSDRVLELLPYLEERLPDFRNSELNKLGKVAFLVGADGEMVCPQSCYSGEGMDAFHGLLHVYPSLGGSEEGGDNGVPGTAFLKACGMRAKPTGRSMAEALLSRGQEWFEREEVTGECYLSALQVMAEDAAGIKGSLVGELKKAPIFLAVQCMSSEEGAAEAPAAPGDEFEYQLARAKECYIVDNTTWLHLVRPLHLPVDAPECVQKLYESLGSQWLTQAVREDCSPGGRKFESERTRELGESVRVRMPLILHTREGKAHSNLKGGAERKLSSLTVSECASLERALVFNGRRIVVSNSSNAPMCSVTCSARGCSVLYLLRDVEIDYFDVGSELSKLIFKKAEQGPVIAQLLQKALSALSARGWPVARFIEPERRAALGRAGGARKGSGGGGRGELGTSGSGGEECVDLTGVDLTGGTQRQGARACERVADFAPGKKRSLSTLRMAVGKCRAEKSDVVDATHSHEEPHVVEFEDWCEALPNNELRYVRRTANGIRVYEECGSSEAMDAVADEFAWYLCTLAELVPRLKKSSLNIFRDIDSNRIAFNRNSSLFFNLRYFYQCHHGREEKSAIFSFWFVVLMHEIAHNLEHGHNKNHEQVLESLCAQHLPRLPAAFDCTFSPST